MKPLPSAWIAAGILFAGATVWINYEVKVKLQPQEKSGAVRELGQIKVGRAAPDFSAQDLSNQTVHLADYRGQKVVLIDFWATWCPPCRMSMPGLQAVLDDFKGRGVEVLSVNQGESAEQAGDFIKRKAYGFHVLLDPDSAIGAQYGVTGIPTLVAVDQEGIVRSIRVGYSPEEESLRKLLEKLVKK
jgi:peroxiredoxin